MEVPIINLGIWKTRIISVTWLAVGFIYSEIKVFAHSDFHIRQLGSQEDGVGPSNILLDFDIWLTLSGVLAKNKNEKLIYLCAKVDNENENASVHDRDFEFNDNDDGEDVYKKFVHFNIGDIDDLERK